MIPFRFAPILPHVSHEDLCPSVYIHSNMTSIPPLIAILPSSAFFAPIALPFAASQYAHPKGDDEGKWESRKVFRGPETLRIVIGVAA
jgi:hypothetical protein